MVTAHMEHAHDSIPTEVFLWHLGFVITKL